MKTSEAIEWLQEDLKEYGERDFSFKENPHHTDPFEQFVQERCVRIHNASCNATELWEAWNEWSYNDGNRLYSYNESQTAFGKMVKARGINKVRTEHGYRYKGIGLEATR